MAKILIAVTSHDHYETRSLPTGLWLSELVHFYDVAKAAGHDMTIVSPQGGVTPIDPESLKPLMMDATTKSYYEDRTFMELLQATIPMLKVAADDYDAIYLTGGHGTMFDFTDNITLQKLIADFYQQDKLVSAVCHGPCGLLNVKLDNGEYLIKGKKMTGYSWVEEYMAFRQNDVPFNLQESIAERGADYDKALLPMTSHICLDGKLLTGQNPMSTKKLAEKAMEMLV